MNDGMYVETSKNRGSGVIIVLLLLVIAAGIYLLFFKKDDKNIVDNPTNQEKVIIDNNVQKIEFTKKINGVSGDLYLSKDNKAYFVLSNILSADSISSLNQDFNVEKNDLYNSDTVKAILIILPNVEDVGYDNETGNYVLTTKNDVKYLINDSDIRNNNRLYLNELKKDEKKDGTTDEPQSTPISTPTTTTKPVGTPVKTPANYPGAKEAEALAKAAAEAARKEAEAKAKQAALEAAKKAAMQQNGNN